MIDPKDPGVSVDERGCFLPKVSDFKGLYIKDADKLIVKDLRGRNRLLKESQVKHSYPYCYRGGTPQIYKAVNSWFIKVTDIKDNLLANNNKTYWVPQWVKEKRFHNWLQNSQDWCFSRSRCWGNPIPLWVSDDGEEVVCVGSMKELMELTGCQELNDIHRESVDDLTIPSKMGKGQLKRIPDVFDCWFESGSMPFAQKGYPFQISEEDFNKCYPAEFIGEGMDQTRGWFYTLNVISTAIRNETPYKNLIVNGIVLASDGEKMSKSKQNYPDPMNIVNKYGSDSIRLYLMNSPQVRGEELKFKEQGVCDVVKDVFIPWYNVYKFQLQNINRYEAESGKKFVFDEKLFENLDGLTNIMDRWIVAANQNLIQYVRKELDDYRLYTVLSRKIKFLELLSNWYVRLNRDRLKGMNSQQDTLNSINVTIFCMLNSMLIMAPYVPFLVENFYQNLKLLVPENSSYYEKSIHFLQIPHHNPKLIDQTLVNTVERMQRIIECCRTIRDIKKLPIAKNPISELQIVCKDQKDIEDMKLFESYVLDEVNVEKVLYTTEWKKYMSNPVKNLTFNSKFLSSINNNFLLKKFNSLLTPPIREVDLSKT